MRCPWTEPVVMAPVFSAAIFIFLSEKLTNRSFEDLCSSFRKLKSTQTLMTKDMYKGRQMVRTRKFYKKRKMSRDVLLSLGAFDALRQGVKMDQNG